MTTGHLIPPISINQRPGHLDPHIARIASYAQENAAVVQADAALRKQLTRKQYLFIGLIIFAGLTGFLLGIGIHIAFFFVTIIGEGFLMWQVDKIGKQIRALEEHPPTDLSGRCALATWLLSNLKHDLARRRRMVGVLDLNPTEDPANLLRTAPGLGNTTVSYYLRRWLDLEVCLIDGNELRLRISERIKVRPGHERRGSISGKTKWKSVKRVQQHRVTLRLQLNPERYNSVATRLPETPWQAGPMQVRWATQQSDEIRLMAELEAAQLSPEMLVQMLQAIYQHIVRR
ncbi:hypothetical protein OSCT_1469 [Oscillochloris trichoides DG-6]|uniref:Uncharacterized protein n=1 Tax=Oscillochloris trichoides DG-6 TaxID=765420 RepID=E1IDR8_9CHLR|nr:hypothetical protein [Oscillochloris trichoides]EFO80696.1 hypothetical protein OSCT_1469 [Oscillochloris trichoides DG-6]